VRAIAIEDRIKAAVFVDGGLPGPRSFETSGRNPFAQLERDPIHYLSRITIPVLMLNGRYDVNFPVEESQKPLFELLGTDEARKRYVLTDHSHVSAPSAERMQESLNWFDRHLGPVRRENRPIATDGK
jgi:pimeloyl-ACP methyl ester carboxylesterase